MVEKAKNKGNRENVTRAHEEPSRVEESWKPVTLLGKKVKSGEVTDIEDIFNNNERILEKEIVDLLLPDLEEDLLLIGQAKGKFGGGQRRIFRQTQKKTMEGNKIKFLTCAVVGNKNGYVGISIGKSKETVPARDKSKNKARLNLIRVRRGCGSWQCNCGLPHSIPFEVTGKCGSSEITLMPAPKGKGLCIEKECAKILSLAGIKDIWCKTSGQTKTKLNLISALADALKKLSEMKVRPESILKLGIVEGKLKGSEDAEETDQTDKVESADKIGRTDKDINGHKSGEEASFDLIEKNVEMDEKTDEKELNREKSENDSENNLEDENLNEESAVEEGLVEELTNNQRKVEGEE